MPWLIVGAAAVGAAIGYGAQVYRNRQAGSDWGTALTKVDVGEVLTAAAGAAAVTALVPVLTWIGGAGLSAVGYALGAAASDLGLGFLAPSATYFMGWGASVIGAAGLASSLVWLGSCDPFAGAPPEIREGIETLRKQMANSDNYDMYRMAARAHYERALYYYQTGQLRAVNAVGRGTVDLELAGPEGVEMKRWTAGYPMENVEPLGTQLRNYNNLDEYARVTVEFVQTKTDPVTDALLGQVSRTLEASGMDMSRFPFTIR